MSERTAGDLLTMHLSFYIVTVECSRCAHVYEVGALDDVAASDMALAEARAHDAAAQLVDIQMKRKAHPLRRELRHGEVQSILRERERTREEPPPVKPEYQHGILDEDGEAIYAPDIFATADAARTAGLRYWGEGEGSRAVVLRKRHVSVWESVQ